jgi:hypothetical protein
MKRFRVLLSITAALAGSCGAKGPSPAAARIGDGNDVEIGDCVDLGKVEGTASQDDKNAEVHAKNAAREQAAAMGATTIKWLVPCCTSVEGEAYRCDAPH